MNVYGLRSKTIAGELAENLMDFKKPDNTLLGCRVVDLKKHGEYEG